MTEKIPTIPGMKIIIMIAALCTTLMGQALKSASVDADKAPQLLPGLDKDLIDATADPCVDFFQYSCGNFSKLYPIPNDRSGFGTGTMIVDHTQYVLHAMVEKAAAGGANRPPNEQKVGDFYASCLNTDLINQQGLKPLQAELERIRRLKSKQELPALLAHYQLIGVGAFFNFGEQQDFKDARKQIAVVDQGGLGLPERDYYFRTGEAPEKTRKEYVEHIAKMMKLLGEPESQATDDAQKIMQLETALAKVSLDITSQRDPQKIYHMMPLADLQKLAPAVDWSQLLHEANFPQVSELNVAMPDFFQGLSPIIEATDLKTIQAYLRWQLLHNTDPLALPKGFDEESFDFNQKRLLGSPEQRPRWKRCVDATDSALGEALGQV